MTAVYDAFGRRVAWHTFVFVYDQSGRILEVSNRATSPVFFGDLVWVEGELLGRVENNVAVGMLAWVPPALGRRLPAPPGLWLLVVGGSGTLWLFALALRTRSPRWGTAGAALALVLVLGVACAPTGLAFYWVVTDYLGKPIAMTDTPTSGEAKVVWKASYAPFGSAVEDLDPDGDGTSIRMPIRFPGQWWDFTSGLHSNFFRDYDPATGRYLEADPIGQSVDLNTYAYAGNDPVRKVDPLGESWWEVEWWANQTVNGSGPTRYLGWVLGPFAAMLPDSAGICTSYAVVGGGGFTYGVCKQFFFGGNQTGCEAEGSFFYLGPAAGIPNAGWTIAGLNAAWSPNLNQGASSWSGTFNQVTGGAGNRSGSVFWSPSQSASDLVNWIGIEGGFGVSLWNWTGFAAQTEYERIDCGCERGE